MASRKKIVAGNWKMNKLTADGEALAAAIKAQFGSTTQVDVVVCPPFTAIAGVGKVVAGSQVALGAQNMNAEKDGAYTGEISWTMLKDLGCKFVILGHSERRSYFGETDEIVNKKTKAALAAGITPIVCVGETLAERNGGQAEAVVGRQVEGSLAGLGDGFKTVVVAYEPVWAIGTGVTASPEQAQDMHAFIRKTLAKVGGQAAADGIRIQYGGSVKGNNAKEIFGKPDIDGGLIGGAALDAAQFAEIVKSAM